MGTYSIDYRKMIFCCVISGMVNLVAGKKSEQKKKEFRFLYRNLMKNTYTGRVCFDFDFSFTLFLSARVCTVYAQILLYFSFTPKTF